MAVSKVPVFEEKVGPVEGRRRWILSVIVRILSLKKLMKSSLLRAIEIHGINRTMILSTENKGLFLFSPNKGE